MRAFHQSVQGQNAGGSGRLKQAEAAMAQRERTPAAGPAACFV